MRAIVSLVLLFATGCAPRVELIAPVEPIKINLSIELKGEVKHYVQQRELGSTVSKLAD